MFLQVSPIGGMGNEKTGPLWLKALLKANYFVSCPSHRDSSKSECNMYCLDCMGNAFCSYCLFHHKDHHVIQIRRSSYHNVVRVSEIQKFIDIACVQTYIINSAKIVFLNERPQPRPGKGVTKTCEICGRSLLDAFSFCSLGCKLGGIMRGEQELTFTLKEKHNRESDEPKKIPRNNAFSSFTNAYNGGYDKSSGDEEQHSQCISPATPPIFNHHNCSRRRKGIPHRAPF